MLRQALFLLIIGVIFIGHLTYGQFWRGGFPHYPRIRIQHIPKVSKPLIPNIPIPNLPKKPTSPLVCPPTNVRRSPCVNNKMIVIITNHHRVGHHCRPSQRKNIENCGTIGKCPHSRKLKPICRGKTRFHTTIYFKQVKGKCVPQYKEKVENIKCKGRRLVESPRCERKRNGKFFCKATSVYKIDKVDSNCKCKTKIMKTTQTCCCKKLEIRTSCNKKLGILTKISISYRLIKTRGKPICMKSVTKSSSTIKYKPVYKTKRGKVDADCKRIDATYVTKRVACKIKTVFLRNKINVVCCRPPTVTVKKCKFNNLIKYLFKRVVRKNVCVRVLKSRKQTKIKCHPARKNTTECFEGKLTQTTTSFIIHQCKCKPQKIRKILPCKCKPALKGTENFTCNRITCKQLTTYHFQKRSCEYYKKICFTTCCCPPPETSNAQCDPSTGNLKFISTNYTYDEEKATCLSQTETKFKDIICNKTEESSQSCNTERPHFRKRVTVTSTLSQQNCNCEPISSVSWECCSVPPQNVSQECRGSSLYEEIITYNCSEDKSRLIAEKNLVVKQIQCPSLNQTEQTERISQCQYKSCHHYYEIKNCKCERRKRCNTYFECCDKQIKTVKCLNGTRSLTTVTDFILSTDKKNCSIITQTNWKTITCEKYTKCMRTPCNQSIYHRITETFSVRNCECQKVNETRLKKICDCPKPKIEKVCLGRINRITTTKYTLVNDDKCFPSRNISNEITVCKPQSIREGPCDPKANRKQITRTYYDIVNCQCQRKEMMTHLLCPCFNKPIRYNRIINQPNCTETVKVYRYMALNHTCGWKLDTTYKGDICCPRQSVKRICVAHNIHRIAIQKYGLELVSSLYPYHKCRKSIQIIDKAVECNRDFSSNEPCLDGVQIRVECRFIKRNCICVKCCRKVAIRPWNCCRKNFCKRECRRNQEYSICFNFTAGRTKCVESRSEKFIPHQCRRDEGTECAAALINKRHGHYKSCVTSFNVYRNCRCERVTKVNEVLVDCRNPISTVECRRNRKVIILRTLIPNNNKCDIKTTEQFANIDCPPHSITTRHEKRRIEYTLVHYVIKDCRCSRATIVKYTQKCERPTVDRICKNHQLVFTHISFHETFGLKLFPQVRSDLRTIKCQKTERIKAQPVKCSFLNETTKSYVVKEKKLRIERHEYFPENCKCKRKITVTFRPNCTNCSEPVTTLGPCLPSNSAARGYQTETITKWQATTNNEYKQSETRGMRICRCERSTVSRECRKGVLTTKRTSYSLPNCQPIVQTTLQPSHCYNNGRENKWIRVKISRCRYPGRFTVAHFERFNFDPSNCLCKRITKSVKTDICCRPCRFETQCVNNSLVNTKICEQSTNMTCKNIVNKTSRPVECPKPIHEVVGNCQKSPIRMMLTTFVRENCQCTKNESFYSQVKGKAIRQCLKNQWKITYFDYELIGKKCVERPPRIVFKSVTCNSRVRTVDSKIDNSTFSRSHFVKQVSECRCVDKLLKKEILKNGVCDSREPMCEEI